MVRKEVERINTDTSYTTRSIENEQFLQQMTDGGGDMTGYFHNGELVKIIERVGLSSCVNITEYYFDDSNLIFVYAIGREFLYVDSLAAFDASSQSTTMECRFYFNDGEVIHKILHGQTRCGGQLGTDWVIDFVPKATRYRELLTNEN